MEGHGPGLHRWLLDGDPAIRWRVLKDLEGASGHFDVLRGLEHFAAADAPRDERLSDAVDVIRRARRKDGRWPTYAPHPGRQWFQLEPPGPSRWNTCRALRVLHWWES